MIEITEVSFCNQFKKCQEQENVTYEKCHYCGHMTIMCKKYGGSCQSKKCMPERRILLDAGNY